MLPAFQLQHLSSKNLKVLFQTLINFLSAVQGDTRYYQHLRFPKEAVRVHFTPWFWAKPADMAGVFWDWSKNSCLPFSQPCCLTTFPSWEWGVTLRCFRCFHWWLLKEKSQTRITSPTQGRGGNETLPNHNRHTQEPRSFRDFWCAGGNLNGLLVSSAIVESESRNPYLKGH